MLKDRDHVDGVDLIDGVEPSLARQERIAELENEVAQLREALARRQQYGIVTGVLAARYRIPPDRAWNLLVRLSQHSNLKIAIVARVLYDRFFGRVAPEDEAFVAVLSAQMPGRLDPLTPVTAEGKDRDGRG